MVPVWRDLSAHLGPAVVEHLETTLVKGDMKKTSESLVTAFANSAAQTGAVKLVKELAKKPLIANFIQTMSTNAVKIAHHLHLPKFKKDDLELFIKATKHFNGVEEQVEQLKERGSFLQESASTEKADVGCFNVGMNWGFSMGTTGPGPRPAYQSIFSGREMVRISREFMHVNVGAGVYFSISNNMTRVCGGPSIGFPYTDGGEAGNTLSMGAGVVGNQPGWSYVIAAGADIEGLKQPFIKKGTTNVLDPKNTAEQYTTDGAGFGASIEGTYDGKVVGVGIEACRNAGDPTPMAREGIIKIATVDHEGHYRAGSYGFGAFLSGGGKVGGEFEAKEEYTAPAWTALFPDFTHEGLFPLYKKATGDVIYGLPVEPFECFGGFNNINLAPFDAGFTFCREI